MNITLNLKDHFKNVLFFDSFIDLLAVMCIVKFFFPQFIENLNFIIPITLFISIVFRGVSLFFETKKNKEKIKKAEEEAKKEIERKNLKEAKDDLKSLVQHYTEFIVANREKEILHEISVNNSMDYEDYILNISVNRKRKIISLFIKDKNGNIVTQKDLTYKKFK